MIHQLPGYIILTAVCVFVYFVNSINLKKNRAIYSRAAMLALLEKRKQENSVSDEELSEAVENYNRCATEFNNTISSGAGAAVNRILRYPLFETNSGQE